MSNSEEIYYDPMTGMPIGAANVVDPRVTDYGQADLRPFAMGAIAAQNHYQPFKGSMTTGDTPWQKMDIEELNRDAPRDLTGGDPATTRWLAQQAGDLLVPTEPWEYGLMAAGPAGRVAGKLGKAGAAAIGMYGSMVDEASADPLTKIGKKSGGIMGDILKAATITRGAPRGVLTLEDFTPPAMQSAIAPSALKNAYRDPRLKAKAEAIWHTYPQYAEQYPDIGPPALKEKAPDPKNPGKFLIAPKKGEIPYASMEEALAKAEEPNFFLEKKLTPEAERFQKQRNIVQQDMDLHGYQKYFDPAKRADIPASDYGPFVDTGLAAAPKTAVTDAKFMEKYGTEDARKRLQEGYAKGQSLGNAENWYYMKQLQDKYVEVLGEKAGKDAFKKEFSGMMAATTGGASPYNNFLMSHYAGYLNKLGQRVDQRAYEMPFPIGGRFASGNMDQAQKYIDSGMKGFDPAKNPKRYDFDNALAGDRNAGVIDEQMSGAFIPGMTIPDWYGPAARVLREEAAKAGADPRAFQDVGWAGLKAIKTEEAAAAAAAKRAKAGIGHNSQPFKFEYEGPMIDQVNRSIETTHRLTGMPIEEIVVRGLIKKEIPMYGLGAVGATGVMGGLARQDKYQPEERM
jgi:hypothetical protein